MQSIDWYWRRLRSMSLPEVLWRVRGKLGGVADRVAHRSRRRILPPARVAGSSGRDGLLKPSVLGHHLRDVDEVLSVPAAWKARAAAAGDKVANHRLSFFNLQDHDLGAEINWNYEHEADRPTPVRFSDDIDYRDHAVTGDCKLVWEPNRHHQLVTLGRAYRFTGDDRYARAAVNQMDSWIMQCPFGVGMNWRSPLELGTRLINWVWALELIRPSSALTDWHADRILSVAYRHMWDVSRKYSRYSSANNHVIGEAAGVFVGSSYFAGVKGASRWRSESRALLLGEILAQTHPDGGTREQAFGYQVFVMQFFLIVGLVARNDGDELTREYWDRLEQMFGFVAAMVESGAPLPMVGDGDDGHVLDLGVPLSDVSALMSIGAVVFDRAEFKALAGEFSEAAFWLLGDEGRRKFAALGAPDGGSPLASRAFSETGYYLLQRGRRGADESISVVFDCAELGFGAIAAHGHADALSFSLRVGGSDVLVDPGTYDYFTYPTWRAYFKSTRAHNAVAVDGLDQSEAIGAFLWGRRASARCVRWEPSVGGGTVSGEHDGYARLDDPVTHRRTIELAPDSGVLTVEDEIIAAGTHEIDLFFHFAEHCRVACGGSGGGNRVVVQFGAGEITMEMDPRLDVSVVRGQEDPILGWVSRGYHRKTPSPTVVARCTSEGRVVFRTRLSIGDAVAGDAPRGEAGLRDAPVPS